MRYVIGLIAFVMAPVVIAAAAEVNIITDRTPSYLEPIAKKFEGQNKIKVNVAYVEDGLISRLKARPTEADIVISKDGAVLESAKRAGVLAPFTSLVINKNIASEFREPSNLYTGLAYRARTIFYAKTRVKPSELSTYAALGDKKWRKKVCVRSGYHDYNLSLFAQMAIDQGLAKTKEFIKNLKDNLARTPKGNDREQAKAVWEGKCDVALLNSYYFGIMLNDPQQKAWAEAGELFFPNQNEGGSYVLISGAGLTKATHNHGSALKFLEYLTDADTQTYMSQAIYEYPLNPAAKTPDMLKKFGSGQLGVKDGAFGHKVLPLHKIVDMQNAIVKILDEVNFDG